MLNLGKSLLVAFTTITLAVGNAYAGEDGDGGDCHGSDGKWTPLVRS